MKRNFYLEMPKVKKCSVRGTRDKINVMLFERIVISKKFKKAIQSELEKIRSNNEVNSDVVFKDSYFLDFINLPNKYSESDL